MLVLVNPNFYYRRSSINGKSFSYVNSYRYYSIVNGRSISRFVGDYGFSSSINGIVGSI